MKAEDLLKAIGGVGDEFVDELLEHAEKNPVRAGSIRIRKTLRTALLAAVIAVLLALLSMGAYALNVFGIKDLLLSSDREKIYLSRQGLQDSKEFQAYQEFMAFYDDYVAHDYYGDQMPQEQDEWMRRHERIYFVYTQCLKDKLLELSDKYGLMLRNDVYEDSGAQWCYTALGLEDFIDDPRFAEDDAAFLAYDDGSFLMQIGWSGASGDYLDCTITRNVKGYFSQGYGDFDAEEVVRQWNYTTGKGTEVTIFWGTLRFYIVYDGPEAFVVASIARWVNDEAFSEEVVTAIADAIDFAALGSASQVDLSLGRNRSIEHVQADAQMQERQQVIEGRKQAELGQWLENYNGLEFRVDSIERSTNLREGGWQMEQFIPDSMGWIDGVYYTYPDWADPETGEMKEGLCLITVALTVKNTNLEESTADQTWNNTGVNNFSNTLLFLDFAAISDGVFCQVTKGADAWSGENPIPGQTAFVHIEPGQTVSYRLAYVAPAALENMVFFTFDSCLPLPSEE